MLRLSLLLWMTALAAGLCGFGFVLDVSLPAARWLCGLCLVLAVLTSVTGFLTRRSARDFG
jgi:hypothetical protein